jgi:RNA polymerase-binding transcription factor DksA
MSSDSAKRAIRERLEARRRSLLSRYQRASADSSRAADAAERVDAAEPWDARVLSLITEVDLRTLENVARALHRLDSDTYGTCTVCNEAIEPARLRALPEATECVDCVRSAAKSSPRWPVPIDDSAEQSAPHHTA